MTLRDWLAAGAALLCLGGCRGCVEDTKSTPGEQGAQPPMPTGMLVPVLGEGGLVIDAGPLTERLAVKRGVKSGAFAELQVAKRGDVPDRVSFTRWGPDARFIPMDAMALLTAAFARALPGFDLFLPRLFAPAALDRLIDELRTFQKDWSAVPTVAQAKERWGKTSEIVLGLRSDAEWLEVRAALVATIREIVQVAKETVAKGDGLWVLGP